MKDWIFLILGGSATVYSIWAGHKKVRECRKSYDDFNNYINTSIKQTNEALEIARFYKEQYNRLKELEEPEQE